MIVESLLFVKFAAPSPKTLKPLPSLETTLRCAAYSVDDGSCPLRCPEIDRAAALTAFGPCVGTARPKHDLEPVRNRLRSWESNDRHARLRYPTSR